MSDMPFYLKKVKEAIVANANFIEVYIPKSYFDLGIAEIIGANLSTIGIFYFKVKNKENEKGGLYLMNNPSKISISFSDERNVKEALVGEEDSYRVFVLNKGDLFMESDTVVQSGANVGAFVKLLHSGKLPMTDYESIFKQYMQIQEDNDTSLRVPAATLEAIIGELARDADDVSVASRLSDNDKYVMIALRDLPRAVSTFGGVSFERMGDAIASGIEREIAGKPNVISPMEETIKY